MRRLHYLVAIFAALLLVPVATSGDKNGSNSTGFDAKSAQNTVRWIAEIAQPVFEVQGNDLAREKRQGAFNAALRKMNGTEIEWVLQVDAVKKNGIAFKSVSVDDRPPSKKKKAATPSHKVTLTVGSNIEKAPKTKAGKIIEKGPKAHDVTLTPFPVASEDWVLALRPGDRLRLEGKVSRIEHHMRDGMSIGLIVSDFKISPLKKD